MLAAARSSAAIRGLAVASAGGGLLVYGATRKYQPTQNESSFAFLTAPREQQAAIFSAPYEIIIPTLQATGRALNLAQTTILMAIDYKTASWYLPWHETDEMEVERSYWEQETEKRKLALQNSQDRYTKRSHPELNDHERLEAKKHEKQQMNEAAIALAEAEERLAEIGSHASLVHKKAAQRLLKLCQENKGVYIKIGQHMANLDYLIPQEYIDTLSTLFDGNKITPYEDVREVIREDLGFTPEQLFESFDPTPIASASLAQVHVAYEKDTGRRLAVKVQHRGLRETSSGDIFALVKVVRTAERMFKGFTWGWLADEIAPHLPLELDFRNEGRNAERAAENIKRTGLACVVPRIIWDQTTERVLTMEFEEGFKATDTEAIERAGLSKRDVAKLISSVFSSQVFLSAFVHCDPHPANVLLRAKPNGKPEMVLVDHGLYRGLNPEFRRHYSALWQSLMLADLNGIQEACKQMGIDQAYTLFAAMLTARPFDEMIERSKSGSLSHQTSSTSTETRADKAVIRGYAQRFLHDIFDLLSTLPRQMLLLLKMNDCLRHIDHSLGSPTNTMVVCGEFAARAIYEDSIENGSKSLFDKFRAWLSYVQVLTRIQIHDMVVWWIENKRKILRLTY